MNLVRTGGLRIVNGVARTRVRKRTLIHLVLGFLLVVGVAACGGEDHESVATTMASGRESAPETTAVRREPSSASPAAAPATYAPAETPAPVTSAAPTTTVAAMTTATSVATSVLMVEEAMVEAEAASDAAAASLSSAAFSRTAAGPSATTFQDYQQARFVSTSEDRVSTFSLDTDRTSFQLALNWARAGYEVDPDSVRAEEWINAFDYGYEHPTHLDSFSITTDLVRHPLDDRKHLARIGFQAPEFRDDRPLNVTLVLDASGSMDEGNRVAIAREAAESIRQGLRSRDRIAVVHFTDYVIDAYTVEHRSPDDRAVINSIGRLAPHGSTNVQAGLNLGVRLADRIRRERPDAYNYVILMSDGVANVDATDPFAILESAYDADSANPLRLITIGVGISNYNDHLLEQLAQHGNGWYRYLSDTFQARSTFSRDNWLALSIPFADQTRAQVTWNDQVVESWRMIGYENRVTSDESFTQDRKEFAEIPVGAATTVFYELELSDRAWGNPTQAADLADVALRWVTPTSGLSNRQETSIRSPLDLSFHSADVMLQLGSVVALSADRYSSLPYVEAGSVGVGRDLRTLADWLHPLGGQLGGLDSYNDLAFLLGHIMASIPGDASGSSGYSR